MIATVVALALSAVMPAGAGTFENYRHTHNKFGGVRASISLDSTDLQTVNSAFSTVRIQNGFGGAGNGKGLIQVGPLNAEHWVGAQGCPGFFGLFGVTGELVMVETRVDDNASNSPGQFKCKTYNPLTRDLSDPYGYQAYYDSAAGGWKVFAFGAQLGGVIQNLGFTSGQAFAVGGFTNGPFGWPGSMSTTFNETLDLAVTNNAGGSWATVSGTFNDGYLGSSTPNGTAWGHSGQPAGVFSYSWDGS